MSASTENLDPTLDGFEAPDYRSDVDFDAYVSALSADATVKGMVFIDLIESIRSVHPEKIAETELAQRGYVSFKDYPQKDYLRLLKQTAEIVHPTIPSEEAVRRLGWTHFPRFANSIVGRVAFGIFFDDIDRLIPAVARATMHLVSPSDISAVQLGNRNWCYELRSMPGTLEPLWMGTAEGMLRHYDLEPKVLLRILGPGDFDVSLRWTEP